MSRKLARELLMKILYQMDLNNDYSEKSINDFLNNDELRNNEINYVKEALLKIIEDIDKINERIEKYSSSWSLNRISKIDLALLRIAIYEIINKEDIPVQVSINEALEISKKYSSEESYKFINGLLGTFVREEIEVEK